VPAAKDNHNLRDAAERRQLPEEEPSLAASEDHDAPIELALEELQQEKDAFLCFLSQKMGGLSGRRRGHPGRRNRSGCGKNMVNR
jgi:hypothetical protein